MAEEPTHRSGRMVIGSIDPRTSENSPVGSALIQIDPVGAGLDRSSIVSLMRSRPSRRSAESRRAT